MALIGILFLLTVPYFIGTMVAWTLRERNAGALSAYLTGFLSLFVILEVCMLVSFRLDKDLHFLELIYISALSVLTVLSLPVFAIKAKKMISERPTKIVAMKGKYLLITTSIVIGIFSFFIMEPSYINEDIFETVETTVTTGTLYSYSALTGKVLETAPPIFAKVYSPSMLYSIFVDAYGIPMWLLGGIIIPCLVYILNVLIVYKIGGKNPIFTVIYLMVLVAGTYLPVKGIPATIGYAVLREGYSGYAVCFGISIPFCIYQLRQKRFINALAALLPSVTLVRLDRIFYALLNPINAYNEINREGKLFIVYMVSVIAFVTYRHRKGMRGFSALFFSPALTISLAITEIGKGIRDRRTQVKYYFAASFCILAVATSFPYSDGKLSINPIKEDKEINDVLDLLEDEYDSVCIYAPRDMMEMARRSNGNIKTLYSKKAWNQMMDGLDYEPVPEIVEDYLSFMTNMEKNNQFMQVEYTTKALLLEAQNSGMNTLIIPTESINDDVLAGLKYIELTDETIIGKYSIFR